MEWFFALDINPVRESFNQILEWDASTPKAQRDAIAQRLRELPYQEFLRTYYWRAIRLYVIYRDRGQCRTCRDRRRLDVHHISYDHHGEEHLFTGDLQTQCRDCHKAEHETRRCMEQGLGKEITKLLYEMNTHRMSRVAAERTKREREQIEGAAA